VAELIEGERGAQAVHRALRMLESFRGDSVELSLSGLADSAGLTLPTAHRIARTLNSEGFLLQTDPGGRYSLGPEIMRLARVLLHTAISPDLVRLTQQVLERLRDLSGETAALHCPIGHERICVAEMPSPHPIRMANGVGNLYPLHTGAAGKAILAWMPATEIDEILLDRPDTERIRRELASVRRRGFAMSLGETVPGASAIAAPIRTPSGDTLAVISIAGPIRRWTRERMLEHAAALVDASNGVNAQLDPGV
jgi:DNA-binding IclR family transcriptional regulator